MQHIKKWYNNQSEVGLFFGFLRILNYYPFPRTNLVKMCVTNCLLPKMPWPDAWVSILVLTLITYMVVTCKLSVPVSLCLHL